MAANPREEAPVSPDILPYQLIPARDLPAVVQRFLDDGVPIGLDVEATGLDHWASKLVTVQLGDAHGVSIADVRHLDGDGQAHLAEAVRLLLSGKVEVQGHNLKYDMLTLAVACGFSTDALAARLYDTMLAEQVILGGANAVDGSGRERASLLATASRYGISLTKEERSWFIDLDTRPEWHESLPHEQLEYAARDIAVLPVVRAGQEAEVTAKGLTDTVKLEMAAAPAVMAMELAGVAVDVDGWRRHLDGIQAQADTLGMQLQTALLPRFLAAKREEQARQTHDLARYQEEKKATIDQARAFWNELPQDSRPMWGDVRKHTTKEWGTAHPRPLTPLPLPSEVNLGSPKQLLEALALVGVHLTDTEAATIEEEAKRRPDVPALALLCRWRKLNKLLTSFGEKILSRVQRDGRVHPSWRQIGAEEGQVSTGRMSCAVPNFQQIPAHDDQDGDSIRRHIVAGSGHVLVIADYSQMEPRILAERSRDAALLGIFTDGADLYTSIAIRMGLLPEGATKEDAKAARLGGGSVRDAAKTITLAVSYGMGPGSLAEKLGCPLDEAREHLSTFFASFPGVARYRDETVQQAIQLGYSATIGGRRRTFRALPQPERYQFITWEGFMAAQQQWRMDESRMRRQAVNHTIQGTGADILKLALVLTFRRLHRLAPSAQIVAAVHDELIVEAPEICADQAARDLETAMEQAARYYLPTVALGEFRADQAPYWRKS